MSPLIGINHHGLAFAGLIGHRDGFPPVFQGRLGVAPACGTVPQVDPGGRRDVTVLGLGGGPEGRLSGGHVPARQGKLAQGAAGGERRVPIAQPGRSRRGGPGVFRGGLQNVKAAQRQPGLGSGAGRERLYGVLEHGLRPRRVAVLQGVPRQRGHGPHRLWLRRLYGRVQSLLFRGPVSVLFAKPGPVASGVKRERRARAQQPLGCLAVVEKAKRVVVAVLCSIGQMPGRHAASAVPRPGPSSSRPAWLPRPGPGRAALLFRRCSRPLTAACPVSGGQSPAGRRRHRRPGWRS